MKIKAGIIIFTLILLSVMLNPTISLAKAEFKDPFTCSGEINYIEPTIIGMNVFEQEDGTWIVTDREIQGSFNSGELTGPFNLNYNAVIESAWTQVGNFWGNIVVWNADDADNTDFEISGSIEPIELVMEGPLAGLPKITITGLWSLVEDDDVYGTGDFEAWAIFIPDWIDGQPHVGEIVVSSFILNGYWDNQGNDNSQ